MFVSASMITHQVHYTLKEIKVTGVAAVTPFLAWFATVGDHPESPVHWKVHKKIKVRSKLEFWR